MIFLDSGQLRRLRRGGVGAPVVVLFWHENLKMMCRKETKCWFFSHVLLQILLGLASKPNILLSTPLFCLATYLMNPTTLLGIRAYSVGPKAPIVECCTLYSGIAPLGPFCIFITFLISFYILFLFSFYCFRD